MDAHEAIELALSGESLMFAGAGFSADAQNLHGSAFKMGLRLADYLSKGAGSDELLPLDAAAEEFIAVHGKDRLIDELLGEFTAKLITATQSDIALVPWKRIYTTNYDDIIEKAYSDASKKILPVTASDRVRDIPLTQSVCVHLNGWIHELNRSTLQTEFKLTARSYMDASLEESDWASILRDDIRAARSVFFIGYSLADLDIRRLLFEYEALKDKCFFVVGKDAKKSTVNICSNFGQVLTIDASTFAAQVRKISATFVPPAAKQFNSNNIERFAIPVKQPPFSNKDLFDLFFEGDVDRALLTRSMSGEIKYFLERREISDVLEHLKQKPGVFVLHSELGNGKSLLAEGIKYRADQSGFSVYTLLEHSPEILRDIDLIFKDTSKKLIVIEDYTDWMDQIRHILQVADDRCSLLLTSRSSIHDVNIDRLASFAGDYEITELEVDKLSAPELDWLSQVFDATGLWGARKALSLDLKRKFLSETCGAEFQAVLLEAFRSPSILSRLKTIVSAIEKKTGYYSVVMTILILNVISNAPSIDRLVDFWGHQVLDTRFKQDPLIRQLIDFSKGCVLLRSSVTAKHILHELVDLEDLVDTLIQIARVSNNRARAIDYHFHVKNELMRFYNLQELLPDKPERGREIIRYYDTIKNLSTVNDYPLFWMQFAIACEVLGDFKQTERYFETAYALAEKRGGFNTVQIDNRYAEFLIHRAIAEKTGIEDAILDFQEAHRLLAAQARNERLYFPYKVARLYEGFYDAYCAEMKDKHKKILQDAASEMITRIHALPKSRQRDRRVRQCESALTTILEKTSGVPF